MSSVAWKKPALVSAIVILLLIAASFVYENVGYVPFHNVSMAPAIVVVGAATDVLTVGPGETQIEYFWLYNDHARLFRTTVRYHDGYHFNRQFSLIITPGYTEPIDIVDAPAPTLTLENDSMGEPFFQVVDIASGVVKDKTIEDAILAGSVSHYSENATLLLRYGHAYDVTADATYSEAEYYTAKGAFVPEPGYTYKMLTCGEMGIQGQNCGPFQYKNQDGGWYDASGP